MRLPNAEHETQPWRIHEIVRDFTLEDVWALPVHGDADDFDLLLDMGTSIDPANAESTPARLLWRLRELLGRWFDLGTISGPADEDRKLPIPGTTEISLSGRLPDDLRGTADDVYMGSVPFEPLYRTGDEFAAEVSNRTVHGVMHLSWVDKGGGRYQGQMGVYVKPRGRFGDAYMALIRPFRYWVVYPALMRQFERDWERRRRSARGRAE